MATPFPPGPLTNSDKANFDTLQAASEHGDLALMSAIRKSDRKQVAIVCAMAKRDGMYCPVPLAVMIEGNPYKDFEDPTQ